MHAAIRLAVFNASLPRFSTIPLLGSPTQLCVGAGPREGIDKGRVLAQTSLDPVGSISCTWISHTRATIYHLACLYVD